METYYVEVMLHVSGKRIDYSPYTAGIISCLYGEKWNGISTSYPVQNQIKSD